MEKIKSPSVNSASLEGLKIANNTHKKEYYENVSTIEDYNLNDTNETLSLYDQEELGNSANLEQLEEAFSVMLGKDGKSLIATSAEDAANGNFLSTDSILTPYWTDKPLKFELQENGTYLILQLDENGNYTAMGFTTEETVNKYLQELDKVVNGFDNSEPSGHENDPRYDAPDDNGDDSEPVVPKGNETDDRYGPPEDSGDDSEPVVPRGNETDDRYGPPDDSGDDSEPVVPRGNETDDRYRPGPSGHENDPRYQA